MRLQAFRIAVHLDDGLGVYPTFAECCSQSRKIGFVLCWFRSEYPEKHLGSSSVSSLVGLSLGFKG